MAKASRTKSLIEEQMEDNSLLTIWTPKWGLIIRPWYSADKLVFSFVEKGQKGAGFDVFMDCQKDGTTCFDDWAYDILHDRRAESILYQEQKNGQQYPLHYKYVTGEKGDKSVGICNSRNGSGYVINAAVPDPDDAGKKLFANVPVTFHDLRKLAERYQTSYSGRKIELEAIRREAAKTQSENRARYSHANASGEAVSPESQPVAATQEEPVQTVPETQQKAAAPQSLPAVMVSTITKMIEKNGNNFFQAVDNETGERYNICITADSLSKLGEKGEKFIAAVDAGQVPVRINYFEKYLQGVKYLFMTGFAA